MNPTNEQMARARLAAKTERLGRRDRIWRRDGGRCYYCSRPLTRKTMTIDHVVARYVGGTDDEKNIVLCCRTCNGEKGNLTISQFREKIKWSLAGMPEFTAYQVRWLRKYHGLKIEPVDVRFWFERRRDGEPPIHAPEMPADLTAGKGYLYESEQDNGKV